MSQTCLEERLRATRTMVRFAGTQGPSGWRDVWTASPTTKPTGGAGVGMSGAPGGVVPLPLELQFVTIPGGLDSAAEEGHRGACRVRRYALRTSPSHHAACQEFVVPLPMWKSRI